LGERQNKADYMMSLHDVHSKPVRTGFLYVVDGRRGSVDRYSIKVE
jgi:hypothetical protein